MASQYGITVDTKQRTQGTRGGIGAYTGDPSGYGSGNKPYTPPASTRQQGATEDPIGITVPLESGLSKVTYPLIHPIEAGKKVLTTIGQGIVGAGVGVANLASQAPDQRLTTNPYTSEGAIKSLDNTIKGLGTDISGTYHQAIENTSNQMMDLHNRFNTPSSPTTPTPTIATPSSTPSTSSVAPTTSLGTLPQSDKAKEIAAGNIPVQSDYSKALENTKVSQGNGLNITTPSGGTGSISFNDNRQLSPDKLGQLQKDIAYNSLQSTKDKFAREAAIVAQRHADYDAYKASRIGEGLNPFLQAALQSKENTANSLASSRLGAAQITAAASKEDKDSKLNQQINESTAKIANSPEFQMADKATKANLIRTNTGQPIGLAHAGLILEPAELHEVRTSPNPFQTAIDMGLDEASALRITSELNNERQAGQLGQYPQE